MKTRLIECVGYQREVKKTESLIITNEVSSAEEKPFENEGYAGQIRF